MTSAAHHNCDVGMAGEHGDGAAHPRLVLAVCILASSLAMIDGSVVNVGLPAIGRSLQAGSADLQWVINAYLLPLSALLLLGGALGDRYGRRRLLVIGVSFFAVASVGCALAPDTAWLWLARAVQGAGAAILLPNSLAILGGAFSGEARGKAIGAWAATGSAAAAVGPVLGGWLIDSVGWRAIFYLNLPIAAAAIGLALAFVKTEPKARKRPALDLLGAFLVTGALGALAWGLTVGSGPQGWTGAAVVSSLAGVALLAGFAWVEKARGDRAMTPLALFASRSFVGLSLLTLLVYGVLGGLLVLLPYMLIQSAGYSATAAGAALLPFPIVLAIASPSMGGLAARVGARSLLTIGALIVAAGVLLITRIGEQPSYWTEILPPLLVISAGMAATAAPLTTAVLSAVDARHTGAASGLNSALARTGGLLATAVLGAVLAAKGADLIADFHRAAVVGAAVSAAGAACAFLLLEPDLAKSGAKA